MNLQKLCERIGYAVVQGESDVEVSDIVYDSREMREGTVFVCMTGAVNDGHRYIREAVEKKAAAIVVEKTVELPEIPEGITVLQVHSTRKALAHMSAAYFGYPDRKLTTIGVTGTKGKTTTTYMIKSILEQTGSMVGLIGTISMIAGDATAPARNTTPESYELQKAMAKMVEAGCEYLVMEVSSQGLKLDRTAGLQFDYGVFTNLSPDHIGPAEHADFEEYMMCKGWLFRQCDTGVVNIDDEHVGQVLDGHTCRLVTFSAEKDADLRGYDMRFLNENGRLGMSFRTKGIMNCSAKIYIPGMFSVSNALTAMAVCSAVGIPEEAVLKGLEKVQVRGRVEPVHVSEDFSVIIDYAHNEVSTRSVLETLRRYEPGRLIAVYGCGGNRSKVRRYDIGEVAGELADLSILTMDNPRNEKVSDIDADIKVGLARSGGHFIEIEDRKEALAYAITHALPGDMIVTLGKGHEDYFEINGVKYHFSEREAINEIVDEVKDGKRNMENGVSLL